MLYERALLGEVAACAREGIAPRIIAFHASGRPLPQEFSALAGCVQYLDIARAAGPLVSGIAGLVAGMGRSFFSPALANACLAEPGFDGMGTFSRRARLSRLLGMRRPDVVHAQFGHLGIVFLPVIEHARLPLVVSFRGQDVLLVGKASAAAREKLFGYAARVLVRSHDMRDQLLQLGCPDDRLAVHPSGIDVENIPFSERTSPGSENEVVILMVGRLVAKKGMADALRAVATCRPGRNGPRLRIAGDGPERSALEELVSELGIGERVEFLGAIPHESVIREMLSAHLFLLPCRTAPDGETEGIPNAIKEAQATGLPVVSTRHAGIPECVAHEASGLLVGEGDVEGLANGLDELLSHPDTWPAMGRKGRELMTARYDIRKLAPALVSHYHAVAEGLPAGQRVSEGPCR